MYCNRSPIPPPSESVSQKIPSVKEVSNSRKLFGLVLRLADFTRKNTSPYPVSGLTSQFQPSWPKWGSESFRPPRRFFYYALDFYSLLIIFLTEATARFLSFLSPQNVFKILLTYYVCISSLLLFASPYIYFCSLLCLVCSVLGSWD
ncbi:hypothetical protein H1C71_013781 [Ictidomys tridecemlineatus]|nr:hypothetical protein H1C71_013781 [Ictidomys tridecemlineatus]KAG3292443.1 hypothetical protein H1C71_013781 [Ictidomys tridecemlineatus]KAG3292444.1 hypothetical protein H1C71_013781 [Ictidomys tridecemlineatus]